MAGVFGEGDGGMQVTRCMREFVRALVGPAGVKTVEISATIYGDTFVRLITAAGRTYEVPISREVLCKILCGATDAVCEWRGRGEPKKLDERYRYVYRKPAEAQRESVEAN